MSKTEQKIIGSFEKVSFPEFGITDVVAKIDTGAYTGALHCTKIHESKQGNTPTLQFSPFDNPGVVITTENYYIKPVTSSNGHLQQRFFVDTEITISDTTYPIMLSLADRSEMKWPVLIGRRFMRSNNLLVDVKKMNR